MPELPEVETIRRGLKDYIVGQKIKNVEIFCAKSFIGEPREIEKHVVREIRRYGKALVLDFDNGKSMIIHLRMTGQLIYDRNILSGDVNMESKRFAAGHPSENFIAQLPNKQTRVMIKFADGILYFNDQRKFGFMKVVLSKKVEEDSFIRRLAKEPWQMTGDELYGQMQRHGKALAKAVILDQGVICGLGNIYADEALYMAGIHPMRRAGSLSKKEVTKLLEAACEVMTRSIESGGSTMATYVKADGTRGDYLEKFAQVFRREGEPCKKCGEEIIKIRVAGRGTHICPRCQKLNDGCEVEKEKEK